MPSAKPPAPAAIAPRLLSVPEACRALCISRAHLYALRQKGMIGFGQIGGRTVIPQSEIDRLVAAAEAQAAAQRGAAA